MRLYLVKIKYVHDSQWKTLEFLQYIKLFRNRHLQYTTKTSDKTETPLSRRTARRERGKPVKLFFLTCVVCEDYWDPLMAKYQTVPGIETVYSG